MIKRILTTSLIVTGLTTAGCNDNSGFQAGSSEALVEAQDDGQGEGDAVGLPTEPADAGEAIGKVSNLEIGSEESSVTAKNPFRAEESSIYSFTAVQELQDEFNFTLDNKDIMVDFDLENIESQRTVNLEQKNRTPVTEEFQQGTPGETKTETFDQEDVGVVDILVVIDDSGSMSQEQKNLSDKLDDLLMYLGQADWKIGVVTTTPKSDCQITLIDSQDPNASQKFRSAVKPGTGGSGNEQGIRQAVTGLQCSNNPWLRADSTVAVLIVSDEDNCSNDGAGCQGEDWEKESYLINYVENTLGKTISQDAGFYGIFSDPDDPCDTAFNDAPQYKRLVEHEANGQKRYGDICDQSYSTTLQTISENIATLLLSQFELNATPDANKPVMVEIDVNGTRTPVDSGNFTVNGKTLTFKPGNEPPAGSKIYVTYTVGSKPLFSKVTLGNDPAAGTVKVNINGTMLNAGQFTVQGRDVTFNQQPAANAMIKIDYRIDEPLIENFSIGATANPKNNMLAIKINDVATNDFTYDPANKTVKFDMTPPDAAKIEIKFTNIDGPKLSYKLPISGNNARNFRLFYNEAPVDFMMQGDVFTIGAADHVAGRTLRLKYEIDDDAVKMFELPNLPIAESLAISTTNMDCDLNQGFMLSGQTLTTDCVVVDQSQFLVTYDYLSTLQEFTVAGLDNPDNLRWEVRIDGVKTDQFTRDGATITLEMTPELGAQVDIFVNRD